ncbi:hypothetical protein [Pseudonocardia zijingensis]|jgi:hypothetical protein|uniref:YtxH-like protein n=1 Tax=Pseudonocardia zijingensis TaxID=153376 RepID=A0ABP4A121_9PSEU
MHDPAADRGFVAAALAGTGGCLLGIRAADALNRKLGRDVPEERKAAGDEQPGSD